MVMWPFEGSSVLLQVGSSSSWNLLFQTLIVNGARPP